MDTRTRLNNLKKIYPSFVVDPLPTDTEEICSHLLAVSRLRLLPELRHLNTLATFLGFNITSKDLSSIVLEFYETRDLSVLTPVSSIFKTSSFSGVLGDMMSFTSAAKQDCCKAPEHPKETPKLPVQETVKSSCDCCKRNIEQETPKPQEQPKVEISVDLSDLQRKMAAAFNSVNNQTDLVRSFMEIMKH